MAAHRFVAITLGLAVLAALPACVTSGSAGPASLTFEQHSLRIPFTVEADGSISLAQTPPLTGRLDLSPILEAEGLPARAAAGSTVQLMLNYGRLYVASGAFRSVWEITPHPGTTTASFRPVVSLRAPGAGPVKDLRLSRYGSSRSPCLRIDRAGEAPVFVTSGGETLDACP